MTSTAPTASGEWIPDTLDRLGHLLIRAHNGDELDPFFVRGHPGLPQREDRVVRSCFYYSVVLTPKLAVVYDNEGAGGMCTLHPEEIAAVWRMPRLLDALGTTYDELRSGAVELDGVVLPEPCWRPYGIDGDAEPTETDSDPSVGPGMR